MAQPADIERPASDAFVCALTESQPAPWAADAYYPGTAAGWWQALTLGHPEFPPTLWFFRNTLAGDLLFTGLFVGAMAFATERNRSWGLAKT
jgi:hypothetical protein